MESTNALYQLIHALSPSEKRYFKLFAKQQHGSHEYLLLFNTIEKQDNYDEKAIQKTLKISKTGLLHRRKNYLKSLILKSLRNYHAKSSVHGELLDLLRNIELLYFKGLPKEALKIIPNAKKLAAKYEYFPYHLQLIWWERSLLMEGVYDIETMEHGFEEEDQLLAKVQNVTFYKRANLSMDAEIKKRGHARTKSQLKSFEKLLTGKEFSDPNQAMSFIARSHFYQFRAEYYYNKQDYKTSIKALEEISKMIEDKPWYIPEYPSHYFSLLSNLIGHNVALRRFKEAKKHLAKLKEYPKNLPSPQASFYLNRVYVKTFNLELFLHLFFAETDKMIPDIPKIEEWLKNNPDAIRKDEYQALLYNIAYTYFLSDKYSETLKWLNKLLNEESKNVRQDISCAARLFNLLVHFELNNLEVLPYFTDSTRRYLITRGKYFQIERILVSSLYKLFKTKENNRRNVYEDLLAKLKPLASQNLEKKILDILDIQNWLEAKIAGISLTKHVRKKLKSKV